MVNMQYSFSQGKIFMFLGFSHNKKGEEGKGRRRKGGKRRERGGRKIIE